MRIASSEMHIKKNKRDGAKCAKEDAKGTQIDKDFAVFTDGPMKKRGSI
jgi:hypothetical protein